MKYLSLIMMLLALAVTGIAQQTQTVTNADLEKFRQKRLAAERELRENYRDLGFPSPDELERQNEEDARDLAERSERYKRLQLEREQQQQVQQSAPVVVYQQDSQRVYPGYYWNGYSTAYYYGYRNTRRYGNRYQKPYRRGPRRGPGFISNPIIRNNWLRQSAPMRRTYRGNFNKRTKRNR